MRGRLNGPSVCAVVPFLPPAVQHAEIRHAIEGRLLPAGSARFHWRPRRVQPDVDTLDEKLRHVHVVVLEKRDMPAQAVIAAKAVDLMNEVPARLIRGVCLPRENDLNGPPPVL